jgi:hypothetical protein
MSEPSRNRSFRARLPRLLGYLLIGLVGFVALLFAAMRLASEPVPAGTAGAAADELAHAIERAVHLDAWQRTGAVRFTFMGRHHHLWDKQNNLHRVTWGAHEVVLDLGTRRGCALVDGQAQTGEEKQRLLDKAYALWVNDSFWLNPLGKFFDDGVIRKLVKTPDYGDALLITFTANGLTPGDSYLWLLDAQARPVAWRMWTKIPLGGAFTSWDKWLELPTGALISTRHKLLGLTFDLEDVAGSASLSGLLNGAKNPMDWCKVQ